ncbi:RNA polymerase sigma factor [Reichenbachiella versicolor]|uniref:RNA polymerase sigma factor n=1 Tax=Reichenbachiella versicolor TaxID=1821036 RepID=UPI000D6E6729|nr:sigma-70 family RNA polymerase sigma factor [Reichenbachiella versicolor]
MNKAEFKKEVLPLSDKMYRLAHRLLFDSEASRDCVQESLIKIWEARAKLEKVDNLPGYILRIVRNTALDKLRKEKRIQELDAEPPDYITDSNYEHEEGNSLILQITERLPDQQKMIFTLRDIEGFTYDEIASSLDLSVNNVRVNLSIARKKIREEMTKIYNYGLR